jgi:hypothetical protein
MTQPVINLTQRRRLLGLIGGVGVVSFLPGCGGAADPVNEDGSTTYYYQIRVLNLVTGQTEPSSIIIDGIQEFTGLPFASISSARNISTDDLNSVLPVDVKIGNSRFSVPGVKISPLCYLMQDNGPGLSFEVIGGIKNNYDPNFISTPFSQLIHRFPQAVSFDASFLYDGQATPIPMGRIGPSGAPVSSIALPNNALTGFRLFLRSAIDGSLVYDSGPRNKGAETELIIASIDINRSKGTVYALDANYGLTNWLSAV